MLIVSAAVSGIQLGLVYGLMGFAIVLLYRSTGVPNFAQGAMATFGAFVALKVFVEAGLPTLLALAAAAACCAAGGVVLHFGVMRPFSAGAGPLSPMIRTLGISLFLTALLDTVWGAGAPFTFPSIVNGAAMDLGRVSVTNQTILTSVLTVLVAGGCALIFRFTDLGLVFRAVSENPATARLLGLRTDLLAGSAWALAGVVSLLIGSLVAPTALLSTDMMGAYLLFAFAGVVLGGMDSMLGALVGGLIVGVLANVVVVTLSPDWAALVVFLVLIGILAIRPNGLFGQPSAVRL